MALKKGYPHKKTEVADYFVSTIIYFFDANTNWKKTSKYISHIDTINYYIPQKLRKTFLGHLGNPLGLLYAKLAEGKQSKAPEFIISFVWNIVGITQENLDLLPGFSMTIQEKILHSGILMCDKRVKNCFFC